MSVTKLEPKETGGALTPMEMLDRAVTNGASPESLEKLLDLQERWEANNARKAFVNDFALARAKFEPVLKTESGYANRYKFETLADVIDAVRPSLSEHGFSFDWVTEDLPEGRIRVTCVITHKDGHEKRNSLSGDPKNTADANANMNEFQRLGGAVTYLQRITLKAALGVAAEKDTDAGGAISKNGKTPKEEAAPLIQMIDVAQSVDLPSFKPKLQEEAKKRGLSEAAFRLVKAHYAKTLKKERDNATA